MYRILRECLVDQICAASMSIVPPSLNNETVSKGVLIPPSLIGTGKEFPSPPVYSSVQSSMPPHCMFRRRSFFWIQFPILERSNLGSEVLQVSNLLGDRANLWTLSNPLLSIKVHDYWSQWLCPAPERSPNGLKCWQGMYGKLEPPSWSPINWSSFQWLMLS